MGYRIVLFLRIAGAVATFVGVGALFFAVLAMRRVRRTEDVSGPASMYEVGEARAHGPVSTGQRMVVTIPDARLEVLGTGHLPWLDDPAGCAAVVREFLGAAPG